MIDSADFRQINHQARYFHVVLFILPLYKELFERRACEYWSVKLYRIHYKLQYQDQTSYYKIIFYIV